MTLILVKALSQELLEQNFLILVTNVHLVTRLSWLDSGGQRSRLPWLRIHLVNMISQEHLEGISSYLAQKKITHQYLIRFNDKGMTFVIQKVKGRLHCDLIMFSSLSVLCPPLEVFKWRQHVSLWKLFTGITRVNTQYLLLNSFKSSLHLLYESWQARR